MAGSRERLLYERRSDYEHDYPRRYEPYQDRQCRPERRERTDRPRRKNGYVFEDIYSDFDEAQGRLSLFRPIRPEFLNLPTSYDIKYNSLPRNYYNYERDDRRRYKKDYYDFRISDRDKRNDHRERREESRRNEFEYRRPRPKVSQTKPITVQNSKAANPKNVAVCKPLRISEQNARYWTTDVPERRRSRPKKPEEAKKNVKFSEVSGCNRKMIVDDPICGRKVVPVRELEVSLDQMIQNGYFEKHNIPIAKPLLQGTDKEEVKRETVVKNVPNGKCLTGNVGNQNGKEKTLPRRTRHLPQVSVTFYNIWSGIMIWDKSL